MARKNVPKFGVSGQRGKMFPSVRPRVEIADKWNKKDLVPRMANLHQLTCAMEMHHELLDATDSHVVRNMSYIM